MSSVLRSPEFSGQSRVLNVESTSATKVKTLDKHAELNANLGGRSETNSDNMKIAEERDENVSHTIEDVKSESLDIADSTNVSDSQMSVEAELEKVKIELQDLTASIEEKYQQAEQQGYNEGYQKGLEESDSVLMGKLESIERLKIGMSEAVEQSLIDNEDVLVEIVFTALCKVFGELAQTREGVISAVRQTVSQLVKRDKLTIRVPEKDYEIIREEKTRLLLPDEQNSIEIIPDSHLKYGGCIVETSGGGLDGRMEIQLKKLMETLLNTRADKISQQSAQNVETSD